MTSEVSFDEVRNPEPYPTIYWMDQIKGRFRYFGWQAFFQSPTGLKHRGEICKVSNASRGLPRGLRKMMKEDAALYAETTAKPTP